MSLNVRSVLLNGQSVTLNVHSVTRNMSTSHRQELIKLLKRETNLERDMGGVSRLRKNKYTLKERIGRTVEWIDKHGFITLQEYANLNNMSCTAASVELKKLTQGEEAPFDYKGSGSHKVWVKKGRQQQIKASN